MLVKGGIYLDRNEYPEMGIHPCFPAGVAAGKMIYPKLYYKIHPFVMEACDNSEAATLYQGYELPIYGNYLLRIVCPKCRCVYFN
jgi:hypothetical protein